MIFSLAGRLRPARQCGKIGLSRRYHHDDDDVKATIALKIPQGQMGETVYDQPGTQILFCFLLVSAHPTFNAQQLLGLREVTIKG